MYLLQSTGQTRSSQQRPRNDPGAMPARKSIANMPGPFRVLPILQNLCAQIDELYIEEVGPFGTMVAEEVRAKWLATGNKVRTSDVDQYILLLAEQLDEPWKRSEFVMRARQLVGIH
jgi:hypothetical protein